MKERIIGIMLCLFGLQFIISGVYHTINFEALHISPGLLYMFYPSPTNYYIPLIILGFTCAISGILIITKKKLAIYLTNIGLVGLIINSSGNIYDFGIESIDTIIWNITALIIPIFIIIYLNHKDYKNIKQIVLKLLTVIIGLIIIYIVPNNL